ncbi:acetolactate synthase small subunit [Enterococcus hulanensis]|uniref:acetolactate synthase small subunit n=1 Tax=Enterococcus TaxID=1350 RepID=UPI000B5A63C1|nr:MULTISPECIES: acetolactate synthase small subunit [Enterococcus]MBO0410690.1 acetolactate synthase small subunit [Enterococcus hulanensis]OTO19369.1 acetolactate synthase, small subunit [Enterococcus sp. 3H8_DIV0648]
MNKIEQKWLSVYVENEIGVLARVAGLFSGKLYNLNSLTVGETESADTSRMTISLYSDNRTFEQVKHQLSNMIEVIQVIDYSNIAIHAKEVMYVKLKYYEALDSKLVNLQKHVPFEITDRTANELLIESINTEGLNNKLLDELQSISKEFEVIRGGSVAIASLTKE